MKDKRPSEEQLIALAKADPRAIARLVLSLLDRVEKLEEIVEAKILSFREQRSLK